MLRVVDGLHTSASTLCRLRSSLSAASCLALCGKGLAAPSATESNPAPWSRSNSRPAQTRDASRRARGSASSRSTAFIAAAAAGGMSGVRPGLSSSVACNRPHR